MNAPSFLPLESAAPEGFPVPLSVVPDARPHLLLADDDAGVRESLAKLLRNSGYQVTLASHGGQVLERVLNTEIDLLLLDLNMPQLDGWSTLDHLRTLKPHLPVIVITAQPNQRDWMRDAGARVLMEKPLDLPLLLQAVRDLLGEGRPSAADGDDGAAKSFRYLASRPGDSDFSHRLQRWGINE
ncbi:MAG: hypothetical protein RJA22_2112 [Verrucomicrobiota bacterium]|jgi:CheY-like chemotaxis protein